MKFIEAKRRLPIVDQLPKARSRRSFPRDLVGSRRRPSIAVWELTSACDQRCLHCGPRSARARPDELNTDEALQLVADLADLGVGEVVLIGGEAYLRNDAMLIVRAIREQGMSCTLTTGGFNLDERRLSALVEAGIQSLAVSIDGLEATHDHVRGREGSWRRATSLISRCRALGIQSAANTQLSALSLPELPRLLEYLADEGLQAWQLQPTVPHGAAAEHEELWLQPHQYGQVAETLDRLLDRAEARGVRIFPGNSLGYFGELEQRLRGRYRQHGHFNGCDAGLRALAIESDGAIKSCPSLGGPKHTGGRVRENSLSEIWHGAPELNWLRQRNADDMWGYCGECYYASECKAGCTAASESLLGRPGNNPFCLHRHAQLAARGQRERIERMETSRDPTPFDRAQFKLVLEHIDPELRERSGPISVTVGEPIGSA